MGLINKILAVPSVWDLSQFIFGCNKEKGQLYRSVIKSPGKLLDFGCADGNTFPLFAGFDYYGVDTNEKLINLANKRYKKFRNAHFIKADILTKPFPEKYFDSILFAGTGHHLNEQDFYMITRVLINLLKDTGIIYFFDIIKDPLRDFKLLNFLISLDQGKFIRTENQYREIFKNMPDKLKIIKERKINFKRLIPTPTIYYAVLRKLPS